jgi:molybdate transport system substrate-binding protein
MQAARSAARSAARTAVRTTILALVLLCLTTTGAAAQTLAVAAAADLQSALPAIAAQFEKDTGHKVALTFGSSGNFFTQIQNGAPFDLLMSADIDYPRQLERAGLAERGSLYEYATGRIVLWTRNDSGIDLRGGLSVLASDTVRRVAIANPEHAPYGRAAVAAIRHEQLYDRVKDKFVLGENISQAAQFVESGNAGVGVIALSLALAPSLKSAGHYVDIPVAFYPAIEQAAVLVSASKQKELARQFIAFLKRPDSVKVLQSFGFALPHTPAR